MNEERKKRDPTWLIKLDKVCFFQVSTDSLSPELTEVDREESRKKNMIMVEKWYNIANFD